ncbi:hypothetical protein HPP92_002866 [Vanilla planifolia]|uniref:Uncharacterized protein n=1 Tax=Vanilla planifolia TaxID=51239 RepID=A0A835VJC1_VANPL|nr:hypothetical protein HPP92_002866 [Vanilla planifolia]
MKLSCPAVIPCELKTSVSSDAVTNDQIIVRAMLSLSEVLLCNYCSEVKVLEECDLKLARQIIHNLEVLTGGRSPVVNESISTKSFDAGNNNKDKDMKSKNETKSALDQAKHDSLATKYFAAHHRESDLVAQDFSQSLQGDFIEQEKELLYRNLWIQTEASLCSLKHDVALVKLEMENLKHHLKAESHASSYSRLEDSIHPLQTPVMTSTYVSDEHVSHGDDEQHIGSNFRCSTIMENSTVETEAENFLRQEDFIVQEEVVDATFLDRLRILKGRYDKVDLFSAELSVNGLCEELGGLKKPVDFMEYGLNIANKSCDSLKMMDMHGEKLAALEPKTGNTLVLSEIEPTGIKASHVADGLAIQSCNPKSQAKFLPSSGSGHGSLSSEWEHVLKDEYI